MPFSVRAKLGVPFPATESVVPAVIVPLTVTAAAPAAAERAPQATQHARMRERFRITVSSKYRPVGAGSAEGKRRKTAGALPPPGALQPVSREGRAPGVRPRDRRER